MCDANGYSDLATATVVVLPSDLPPVAVFVLCTVVAATAVNG